MKKVLMSLVVAITMLFAAGEQAKADGDVILGALTCIKSGPGVTYVLFSKFPVTCTYNGVDPSPQTYTGISGILLGLDLEWEPQGAMVYLVLGGANTAPDLAGDYAGIKASMTIGAGPQAQAGLMGFGNGIELVPLGLGGQLGAGVTGGIGYLQLAGGAMPMAMPAKGPQVFIVYFEFNKSDLTAAGNTVVGNAAGYYKANGTLKVAVAGFTDTSGTAQYNEGLSHRRADTVRTALIKDGVPASVISTAWYGKTHLAVPTPDGVKEPRNRRAEITIGP
jgi:hypothetical protein